MLAELNDILEIIIIVTSVFLLQKYVFLEPEIQGKKRRLFYWISLACIATTFVFWRKDAATIAVLLAGGLHISLGRTEHRIRGFFLIIPIVGMVDGLIVPILIMPTNISGFLRSRRTEYFFIVSSLLLIALLVFWIKGKNWRKRFQEDMENRHLRGWESFLLCLVGILMLIFSNNVLSGSIDDTTFTEMYLAQLPLNVFMIGFTSLILAVMIIVLIIQGNLREEKERADAANKAKTAFISNISHEIRTPMNAIVGMTQILLRKELPRQEREYLLNIQNSGNALLAIINDLLDLSKIESGKMELVDEEYDLMSMLSDLGMIILNRIGSKPVELLFDIDPDIPAKLYGDALRIRQIVINLMNNATKFTEEGSVCLEVKVKQMRQDDVELYFSVKDTGQGIREEDMEKLFGSFQQVDARKNHHKEGTGLGLSISKQFVELMQGSIGVRSEYGQGSEFYFTIHQKVIEQARAANLAADRQAVIAGDLQNEAANGLLRKLAESYRLSYEPDIMTMEPTTLPVFYFTDQSGLLGGETGRRLKEVGATVCGLVNPMAEDAFPEDIVTRNKPLYSYPFCQFLENREASMAEDTQTAGETETEGLSPEVRVLIVDDNEINRMIAAEMLSPLGIQIDTASDGEQALEMVQEEHYHVIFMDHLMPVMNGIEAAKAIRALKGDYYKQVPIIALTANTAREQQEEYRSAGMNDYLSKPIDMEQMCGMVRRWA